jgi:hypothetical protein
MIPRDSAETRQRLKEVAGTRVLLAFSRGKDAIGAWLALLDDGFDVIPVHFETVPGLSFVQESLAYYERFFGARIHSVPHPSFWSAIDNGLYQTPRRAGQLAELSLHRKITYSDVYADVARAANCSEWHGTGVRISDSLTRRMALKTHGSITSSAKKAHIIWDWSSDTLRQRILSAGVKLPVDYEMFGRSFDGIGVEYLSAIKQRFPDDYRRVLEFFPLAEAEIFRDEHMRAAK